MRSTGGSASTPICSAFSGSRPNSSRPTNSSSLTTDRTLPTTPDAETAGRSRFQSDTRSPRSLGNEELALDEGFELRAGDVVRQLLRRALHQVGRRGDDGTTDATVLGDLRRAHRVDDDACRVGGVPHLELVLQVQWHVAEG